MASEIITSSLLPAIFNFSDDYFIKPRSPRSTTPRLIKKKPRLTKRQLSQSAQSKCLERLICDLALSRSSTDNSIRRHMECKEAKDLSILMHQTTPRTQEERAMTRIDLRLHLPGLQAHGRPWMCYPCGKRTHVLHDMYVFSCPECGDRFEELRTYSRDLTGNVALVTGARSKLGYQVALKLLRSGATVVVTTRQAARARVLYEQEPDYEQWRSKLYVYPESLDFLSPTLDGDLDKLKCYVEANFGKLDILINNAAQTIRTMCARKEETTAGFPDPNGAPNRYGDPNACPMTVENSWTIPLDAVTLDEFTEVFRVNSIAPAMLFGRLRPLMLASTEPYLLNVHAREGLFGVAKSRRHVHTNMAKAALAMMTNCTAKTDRRVRVHGVDPGWISQDEYYPDAKPWLVAPPLDEVDGAARILYPLFQRLKSCAMTRRHFMELLY